MQTLHKWKLAATHQISEEFSWTYVGWSIIPVTASNDVVLPHRDVFQTQENILFILSILLSVQKHCRQAESRTSSRWSSNSRLVSMHLQTDSSQRTIAATPWQHWWHKANPTTKYPAGITCVPTWESRWETNRHMIRRGQGTTKKT